MAKTLRYKKEFGAPTSGNTILGDAVNAITRPIRAVPNGYIRAYNNIAALYNNKVANKEYEKAKEENEKAIKKNEAINNIRNLTKNSLINQYSGFDADSYINNKKSSLRGNTPYSQWLQRIRETANTRVDGGQIDRTNFYGDKDDPLTFARKGEGKLRKEFSALEGYNPINSGQINLGGNTYSAKDVNGITIYQDKNGNIVPKSKLINEIDNNLNGLVNRDNVNKIYEDDYNERNTGLYGN